VSSKYSLDDRKGTDLDAIPEVSQNPCETPPDLHGRFQSYRINKIDSKQEPERKGSRISNITQGG